MLRRTLVPMVIVAALLPTPARADGPGYTVPAASLEASLSCPQSFGSEHDPVLLVHGTAVTAEEHWGWNYADVLPPLGYDVCLVRLPNRALGDIQVSAEYVVHAIRTMYAVAGRPIDVLGHSQGALEPRWALKWWPDTRAMVDDFVPLAGPNHGADSAAGVCNDGACFASAWQMSPGSAFMAALNRGDETPDGPDYTSIYSQTDELVQPATSPVLEGATNILVQDRCPGRPVHHVGLNSDPVVFELVIDAFERDPGAADPSVITPIDCIDTLMPGVNEFDAIAGNLLVYGNGALAAMTNETHAEPPVAEYAQGDPAP